MLAKNLLNLHYFDFGKTNPKVTSEAQIPTFSEGNFESYRVSQKYFTSVHIITNPVKTALYSAVSVHGTDAHFTAQALQVRATTVTPFLTFHKNTHVKYKIRQKILNKTLIENRRQWCLKLKIED